MPRRLRSNAGASSSQPPPQPSPDELRFLESMEAMAEKTVVSTPPLDFDLIEEMGILDDFERLTGRVGLTRRFFDIPAKFNAYTELTKEFLASLGVCTIPGKGDGVQFQLRGQWYWRSIHKLFQWFHIAEA